MSVKISDRDNGYAKLKKAIEDPNGGLKVGVDATPHEGGDLTNDEIGNFHEFGLGNNPQRSFLRGWVDANGAGIKLSLRHWAREIIYGNITKKEALHGFGVYCVKGIRKHMLSNIPPPLAPATIARKGSDIALIDTQQLINAVTFEINGKDPEE